MHLATRASEFASPELSALPVRLIFLLPTLLLDLALPFHLTTIIISTLRMEVVKDMSNIKQPEETMSAYKARLVVQHIRSQLAARNAAEPLIVGFQGPQGSGEGQVSLLV